MIKTKDLFFPAGQYRKKELYDFKDKFVHYTSADTALKILNNRELWFRNTKCMNDISEIQHGLLIIEKFLTGTDSNKYKNVMFKYFGFDKNDLNIIFERAKNLVLDQCYIASFSQMKKEEQELGLLSMWRAYGSPQNSAAIIFNREPYLRSGNTLGIYMNSVEYGNEDDLYKYFDIFCDNLEDYRKEIIERFGEPRNERIKENLKSILFSKYIFLMTCFKNKIFSEENEWRSIFIPDFNDTGSLQRDIVTLDGSPQIIYKLSLENAVFCNKKNTALNSLIYKILIGPGKNVDVVQNSFQILLKDLGVSEAFEKVHLTNIPLRVS